MPVLYWLSGLTCNDENFMVKSGVQQYAEQYNIAIVCPDTSPRGKHIPDDSDACYDFGLGAGFYVNATQNPWSNNYQMYNYVVFALPNIINKNFPVYANKASICGHSMGGHGALMIALRDDKRYQSVSAFSPICSPIHCPWGQKALSHYLGNDQQSWLEYDATELLKTTKLHLPILIDQGKDDEFLTEQLNPELFLTVGKNISYPITFRYREGHDHSYFFIQSFIAEHIKFHAQYLH